MVISLPQNPLTAARTLWRWAIVSLPLDPLIYLLFPKLDVPIIEASSLAAIAYFALGTGVLVAIFGSIPEIKAKASEIRKDLERHARSLAFYGIGFGLLLILLLVWQTGFDQLPQYATSIVVALGTLASVYKSLTKTSGTERIQLERQLFALSVIPLAATRIGSLLITLYVVLINPSNWLICLSVWLLALVTLFALEPAEDQFMMACKRCGSNTARLDLIAGLCPNCLKRTT